ncbi:hypothetical protein [Polaribacter ponticola]|uniref:Uncharacterized protein n=1 Tax=Polaribacter ponticola TaxID=2978475 RepID=A0ABT5SA44_9FLAO|nr:hypothetical protein [Polaribacter sp. MSW5]MDD7914704.1 hypothetical protein [Polaribacter sp. MSW5]
MKTKYLNLFWAVLATVILIYEFSDGKQHSIAIFGQQFKVWYLTIIWSIVAIKNYYSFYFKLKSELITQK